MPDRADRRGYRCAPGSSFGPVFDKNCGMNEALAPGLLQIVRDSPGCGADALLHTLLECGVDTVFGYPGGAALPLYDALFREPRLRHVLVRHEQAAVHAAEGYA